MEYPMSIDTAVEILAYFIAKKGQQADTTVDVKQKNSIENQIDMLQYETDVIYGLEGDDKIRRSIYDKIYNLYSPQMKYDVSRI
jgi:hypothetical protein